MTANETTRSHRDRRRFLRVPSGATIGYRHGSTDEGLAVCRDFGPGGVCLELGHPLENGAPVLLAVAAGHPEYALELKAAVTWCRPVAEGRIYRTGLRVYADDMEAQTSLARLAHQTSQKQVATGSPSSWTNGDVARNNLDQPEVRNPNPEHTLRQSKRPVTAALCGLVWKGAPSGVR